MIKTLFLVTFSASLIILTGCNKGPKPVAAFTIDKPQALARDTITFTNQSTDADTYHWDFGDDSVSTDENPRHAFRDSGTYTITLTATGDGGTNSAAQDLIILPSLTGKWSSNFTYYSDFNGSLILFQNSNGEISGSMELMTGSGYLPLSSTSKITATSVTIEAKVQGGTYSFKGTVNEDYDYIRGSFFVEGMHFGNWYAVKK